MLPLLRLGGPAMEQGEIHGRELRDRIRHNVAVYFDRFLRDARVARDAVLAQAMKLMAAIDRSHAAYAAGVRGIARGSGCDLAEIAALNARYEILYYQWGVNAEADAAGTNDPGARAADGCTSFAIEAGRSATGELLIGQNWDWIPEVQGAVIHTEPDTDDDGGTATLAFTEAGIFGGKIGLNSHGIGLCINGLMSTDDDWDQMRTPFHVRCHDILRARAFDAAVAIVTGEPRACSTNFLIAQSPNHIANIEAAPKGHNRVGVENGWLTHTNHFFDPDALGIAEPRDEAAMDRTRHRLDRMQELLRQHQGRISEGDLRRFLCDKLGTPQSICRHEDTRDPPEERYITVTSVILNLATRTMHLTDGPPDLADYDSHTLD